MLFITEQTKNPLCWEPSDSTDPIATQSEWIKQATSKRNGMYVTIELTCFTNIYFWMTWILDWFRVSVSCRGVGWFGTGVRRQVRIDSFVIAHTPALWNVDLYIRLTKRILLIFKKLIIISPLFWTIFDAYISTTICIYLKLFSVTFFWSQECYAICVWNVAIATLHYEKL
jgi:hypothetical protein